MLLGTMNELHPILLHLTYRKGFRSLKSPIPVGFSQPPSASFVANQVIAGEYNRRIYEKRRIEQIKSKKLMFSRGNDVNISISNPQHNLNKLFRM